NYKNVSQDIRDQMNAEAEAVQIILTGIDNYNVFAMENEHPEQPESSNDIYLAEQGDLRYFNSLEHEVDTLNCQLETQKT
ncbi:hypothetical protein Tco_0384457, partial [Tanacetum coccineum]